MKKTASPLAKDLVRLANWTGSGNPRHHKGPWSMKPAYRTTKPRWRILEGDAPEGSIKYRCNLSFWRLVLLPEICTPLITVTEMTCSRGKLRPSDYNIDEPNGVDQTKMVRIMIDYPLKCTVEIQVAPSQHVGSVATRPVERGIGYYLWVAARTYADIYEHDWKRVGVWGHGFDDLWLEGFDVCPDNTISLVIGS